MFFLYIIKGQDLRQFVEDSFSVGPVDAGICDGLAILERLAGVLDIQTQTETKTDKDRDQDMCTGYVIVTPPPPPHPPYMVQIYTRGHVNTCHMKCTCPSCTHTLSGSG